MRCTSCEWVMCRWCINLSIYLTTSHWHDLTWIKKKESWNWVEWRTRNQLTWICIRCWICWWQPIRWGNRWIFWWTITGTSWCWWSRWRWWRRWIHDFSWLLHISHTSFFSLFNSSIKHLLIHLTRKPHYLYSLLCIDLIMTTWTTSHTFYHLALRIYFFVIVNLFFTLM